jgi:hypothetical protein
MLTKILSANLDVESRAIVVLNNVNFIYKAVRSPVSSTNKNGRHNITQIELKVALNTITLTLS